MQTTRKYIKHYAQGGFGGGGPGTPPPAPLPPAPTAAATAANATTGGAPRRGFNSTILTQGTDTTKQTSAKKTLLGQ